MNKEAIAAKTLLKALVAGTGVAGLTGGAGYLGHKVGYKGGATRATNEMASAFSEANATENQQIRDSFNSFNKQENASIADSYMRRGMALGAQLHAAGKIKFPSEMSKKSSTTGEDMNKQAYLEEIYNEAFNDELEKNAGRLGAIYNIVKGSFKNLGQALRSGKNYVKGEIKGSPLSGVSGKRFKKNIKQSKAALGVIGGTGLAAGGAGYALND